MICLLVFYIPTISYAEDLKGIQYVHNEVSLNANYNLFHLALDVKHFSLNFSMVLEKDIPVDLRKINSLVLDSYPDTTFITSITKFDTTLIEKTGLKDAISDIFKINNPEFKALIMKYQPTAIIRVFSPPFDTLQASLIPGKGPVPKHDMSRHFRLLFKDDKLCAQFINEAKSIDGVQSCTRNYITSLDCQVPPNESSVRYQQQWHLDDDSSIRINNSEPNSIVNSSSPRDQQEGIFKYNLPKRLSQYSREQVLTLMADSEQFFLNSEIEMIEFDYSKLMKDSCDIKNDTDIVGRIIYFDRKILEGDEIADKGEDLLKIHSQKLKELLIKYKPNIMQRRINPYTEPAIADHQARNIKLSDTSKLFRIYFDSPSRVDSLLKENPEIKDIFHISRGSSPDDFQNDIEDILIIVAQHHDLDFTTGDPGADGYDHRTGYGFIKAQQAVRGAIELEVSIDVLDEDITEPYTATGEAWILDAYPGL